MASVLSIFTISFQIYLTLSGCGWYGPFPAGNDTDTYNPRVPLNICGNYGIDALAVSEMWTCNDEGDLIRKIYDGHNCDDSTNPTIEPRYNQNYDCTEGECYDHVVAETYRGCYFDNSNDITRCTGCTSSSVEILNLDTCITTGDTSQIVLCNSEQVVIKKYTDQNCEQDGEAQFFNQGCSEEDRINFVIHECNGAISITTFNGSVVVLMVMISLFLIN